MEAKSGQARDGQLTRIAKLVEIDHPNREGELEVVVRRTRGSVTHYEAEAVLRRVVRAVEGHRTEDYGVETGRGDTRDGAVEDLERKLRAKLQGDVARRQRDLDARAAALRGVGTP